MSVLIVVSLVCAGSIMVGFGVHWHALLPLSDSRVRLEKSRLLYILFSTAMLASSWSLFYFSPRPGSLSVLIPVGCSFALLGDWFNLQFSLAKKITRDEPVFGGIVFFCVTQMCFLFAFRERMLTTLGNHRLSFLVLLLFFLVLPLLVFVFRVFNKSMPKRIVFGSLVYGSLLGTMAAVAVFSALYLHGAWLLIGAGGVLYLVSDARMGMTTLHGYHPPNEFQIPWITYLAAQALIINGYALLSP